MTEERKTESGELTALPRPYEEKAYKYADKQAELYRGLKEPSGGYANIVDAYIAGATENGIHWHDLRKDPNDLPIGEVFYWFDQNPNLKGRKVYGRSIGYYNSYEKEWHGYYQGCPCRVQNVIVWCEIPTFKE